MTGTRLDVDLSFLGEVDHSEGCLLCGCPVDGKVRDIEGPVGDRRLVGLGNHLEFLQCVKSVPPSL